MSLFIVEVKHKTHKDYVPYVPDGYTEPVVYTSAQEAHAAAEKAVKEMENPASEYKARVSLATFPTGDAMTYSCEEKPWGLRKRWVAFIRAYSLLWWVTAKWFFRVKVFRRG